MINTRESEEIGVLFNKYPVIFPKSILENNETIAIHGENGSGKTKTLELLAEYYKNKGENVIYFPVERIFNLTSEQVESMLVMSSILDENDIFKKLDIQLNPWDYENQQGNYISSGYLQLVNFIGTIMFAKKESIVLIDTIEINLHYSIKQIILDVLSKLDNTKKLIATIYQPETISKNNCQAIHIKKFVELK